MCATETVDSGSTSNWVKPKTKKLVFTASALDVQLLKGQCEAFTVSGRQVAAWLGRPKGPLAVSWPRRLDEWNVITCDWCIVILLSREGDDGAIFWTNPLPLRSWPFFRLMFGFLSHKFAAYSKPSSKDNHRKASYSKPSSKDNHRKASYPRTQQREQGAGLTQDHAVVVKTMPSFFFRHCPFFREGWEGSCSSRLSRHASRSSIILLGRSPKRYHSRSLM